ncbi:Ig-like domain-containing protein, partial [Enterobacter cancerogenus]
VPVSNVAVSVTTNNVPADGTTTDTAQAKVTSAAGKPLAGVKVEWTVDNGSATAVSPLSTTTDANGVATVSLTNTVAETNSITATAGGKSAKATVRFFHRAAIVAAVTLTYTGKGSKASPGIVTATVTDVNGNPVKGVELDWDTPVNKFIVCKQPQATTDEFGKASAQCDTDGRGSVSNAIFTVTIPAVYVDPAVSTEALKTTGSYFFAFN